MTAISDKQNALPFCPLCSVSGSAYLTAVTWCEVCVWVSLCRVERLTTVTCRVAVRTTRRTRLRPSPTTTTIGGGFLSLSYCRKDSPPLSSREEADAGTGRCLRLLLLLLWLCLLLLLLLVLDMIGTGTGTELATVTSHSTRDNWNETLDCHNIERVPRQAGASAHRWAWLDFRLHFP